MVPDKFNMVDMGGIDLIMMQGEEVPGLYDRLVESITQCQYQCLYNWLFDGVVIPPSYVKMEVGENDEVEINEGVTVTPDDVIHIYSMTPPSPEPEIIPLLAEENGAYNAPAGVDGFNPVTVNVPSHEPILGEVDPTSSIGSDGDYYIKGIYFGDYIENTAEIYFNTGIILNAHDRVEMAARILNKDGGGYRAPFGARKSSMYSNAFGMFAARNGGSDAGFFRSGNESYANFDGIRTKDALFVAQDQLLTCTAVDGTILEIRSTGTVNDCVNSCFLFNLNSSGAGGESPNGGCIMRLYYFKIYNSNDELRLHLVPHKDANNVYCLYDTVSQSVIYANDSTRVTGNILPAGTKEFFFMSTYYKSNGIWESSKIVSI